VLTRNKARSLLTILGITIGIAAVINVVAIGAAGQNRVQEQLNNLGDNYVWIEAGGRAVNGVRTGTHAVPTLTFADAEAIKAQVSLIKKVTPNVDGSIQVIYGNQNWYTTFRGIGVDYFSIRRYEIQEGAVFSQDDVDRAADVCLVGRTVSQQLFGAQSPVDQTIRLAGRAGSLPCKVIGTLVPKGQSFSGQDQDDVIMMPYTTAQKKIKGNPWLDDILSSAVSFDAVKLAGLQAAAVLRDRHHLRPDEPDDFNIRHPEDIIAAQMAASRTLATLLAAVASVSLIVGGIGIMNIMLVSVTERTREIGLRVAVGATAEAIQLQFLCESVLLSVVGGIAGILLGVLGSIAVGVSLGWPLEIAPQSVLLATAFAVAIGAFFGYYPARVASRLDPIVALRTE
jgi:putative ABC transport system permease protein